MLAGSYQTAWRTFGYKRFEILSAFINASVLTVISIYLIYEAVLRFLHPEPVKSGLMLLIAVIGLFANLVAMLFLHRDSKKSLNVKAAYIHLLGDIQDHDILFEAHIETCKDLLLSDSGILVAEIDTMLKEKYHITHTTMQVEFDCCGDKAMIKQPN